MLDRFKQLTSRLRRLFLARTILSILSLALACWILFAEADVIIVLSAVEFLLLFVGEVAGKIAFYGLMASPTGTVNLLSSALRLHALNRLE